MATVVGGSFKRISAEDIKVTRSVLNQLVDVIQEDVSGSSTRRAYQVFVTGGVGPGVTSSLFQTVYDQDFTLQTSNPMLDMTVGLWYSGSTVQDAKTGEDSTGKLLFPSQSLMMREKIDIYRQYAATLLGDADQAFYAPFAINSDPTSVSANRIDEALFLSYKRLFSRDGIKRETYAVRLYRSGTDATSAPNVASTSTGSAGIFTDIGASTNQQRLFWAMQIKPSMLHLPLIQILRLFLQIESMKHSFSLISDSFLAMELKEKLMPSGFIEVALMPLQLRMLLQRRLEVLAFLQILEPVQINSELLEVLLAL